MRAGRLNKRVTFQREVQVSDTAGGFAKSWQDLITVWSAFILDRGNEGVSNDRTRAAQTGKLQVRSSSDSRVITPADRVIISGEAYQIRSIINPDQRNKMLELVVEGGVAT